ncbi:DNA repair protein rhp57 [Spiromyces aspiralis]|uniref:DNA repair protein rhp57 n=1 Tax=Spiromyces aspiralis TaxID=68401 RepID=A0ACC1HKU5_9FUNG|nr:DNA repair protein rhp57 [Spiromyces aspiralis]
MDNVNKLWELACWSTLRPGQRAMRMRQLAARERWLSTGDDKIDRCLGGGVRTGCLTEVTGESAAGKSQLCLQLSVWARLPEFVGGLDGEVVYISTEAPFPSRRAVQIGRAAIERLKGKVGPMTHQSLLSGIHLADARTRDELIAMVQRDLPLLIDRRQRVRLVVIDSIAADFRFSDDEKNWYSARERREWFASRTQALNAIGDRLRRLAYEHNCAVVCVNQISDQVRDSEDDLALVSAASTAPQQQAEGRDATGNGSNHIAGAAAAASIGDDGSGNGYNNHIAGLYRSSSSSVLQLSIEEEVEGEEAAESGGRIDLTTLQPKEARKAPALGLTWGSNINSRIVLFRRRDVRLRQQQQQSKLEMGDNNCLTDLQDPGSGLGSRWWIELNMGPFLVTTAQQEQQQHKQQQRFCEVTIDERGIHAC